jgi:hypothetical protein
MAVWQEPAYVVLVFCSLLDASRVYRGGTFFHNSYIKPFPHLKDFSKLLHYLTIPTQSSNSSMDCYSLTG